MNMHANFVECAPRTNRARHPKGTVETSRQLKARREMDAAKAFDLASDLEDPLSTLKRVGSSLSAFAGSCHISEDETMSDALSLLASATEDAVKRAENLREEIFHLTWGYRYPEAEQSDEPWEPELIARMENTLREQRAARKRFDKAHGQPSKPTIS